MPYLFDLSLAGKQRLDTALLTAALLGAVPAALGGCAGAVVTRAQGDSPTAENVRPLRDPPAARSAQETTARKRKPARARASGRRVRTAPTHPEVVRIARKLLGARRLRVAGKRYRADCSGLMQAIYTPSGINLYALGGLPGVENGVAIIHRYVKRYGTLHRGWPRAGELAFFSNTYDRNGDGRRNDPLTHIGVVEKVRRDGTAVVIHFGSGSVRRMLVNPHHPMDRRNARGEPINDYLRREKDGARLSGALLVAWGRLPSSGARLVAHR